VKNTHFDLLLTAREAFNVLPLRQFAPGRFAPKTFHPW